MLDVVVVGILPVLVGADALGEGEGGAVADVADGYAADFDVDVGVGAAGLERYLAEGVAEVEVDGVGCLALVELLGVDEVYLLGDVIFYGEVVEAGIAAVEVEFLVAVDFGEEVEVVLGPVAVAGLVLPLDGVAAHVDDEVAAEVGGTVVGVLGPHLEGAGKYVVAVGIGSTCAAQGGYVEGDTLLLLIDHLVLRAGGQHQRCCGACEKCFLSHDVFGGLKKLDCFGGFLVRFRCRGPRPASRRRRGRSRGRRPWAWGCRGRLL